jgi:hypothetical protein
MEIEMNKNVVKAVKLIWRFAWTVLDVLLIAGSDKEMKPGYASMKAKRLYEDGQISASQYRRSLGRD